MLTAIDYDKVYSIFLEHYKKCQNDPETIIMRQASKQRIKSPLFISWEITSRCNLSCKHCRAAYNNSRNTTSIQSLENYMRVIQDFGENEVYKVGITGGEPFLHPYLPELISACKREHLDIILYTNATLIGSSEASMLSSILSDDDIIHVSLDGGTEEDNDSQRGIGVFQKALHGLDELCKQGINIRLNVVPTIYNENSLLELCDIALHYKVKEFGASPLMTCGRARNSKITPDYKKLFDTEIKISEKLKGTPVNYIGGISGTVHNLLDLPGFTTSSVFSIKRESSNLKTCDAASRKLFIDANGDCYPCSLFASDPVFIGGNIFDSSLHNVWTNPKWQPLRDGVHVTSSECQQCTLFSLCNGGCMALAYQATGRLGNMDPRCPKA